ncbi:endonuclease domain-containing protein [Catellatospora sp. IY07-71]|uniref:endonuclease domain-containing protein n=1 Tax=Catellatospora sp. IY07-71 TaxID=2728827 RepID=UPI001BB37485|nr:hypothetical protein [Catellatospora sp. IY07-71]
MSRTSRQSPRLVGKVFSAREAIGLGLVSANELRGSAWQRIFRGVYADARMSVSHLARGEAAVRWLIPAQAAVAGRSAVAFHGGLAPLDAAPVEVLVPPTHRFGPVAGLRVHTADVSTAEFVSRGRARVTSPLRTCWDLAQWYEPAEAVAHIDSLLGRGAVDLSELRRHAHNQLDQRGGSRFGKAVELADGGAQSAPESHTRVGLVLAGLPRPVTQHVIEDRGRFVARVDLAWPEYRVAVEYDGVWHAQADQFHLDRQRLNRLVGQDWIVLHLTAQRLREDLPAFTAEVRTALRTRGWHPVRRGRGAVSSFGDTARTS